jgi:hypothetical protein
MFQGIQTIIIIIRESRAGQQVVLPRLTAVYTLDDA